MLALQRAGAPARPATPVAARRAAAPSRPCLASRGSAAPRRVQRLHVSAVAGAAVVCAAGGDNAAEAQAWIDAWRAKNGKGGKAAAGDVPPNVKEAAAWIDAWKKKNGKK